MQRFKELVLKRDAPDSKEVVWIKKENNTILGFVCVDGAWIKFAGNDIANCYTKSETYSKQEINALIGESGHTLSMSVVSSLSDVSSPAENVIYLVGPTGTGEDKYAEYIYSGNEWIKIGDTSIDLSNYVTSSSLATVATSGQYSDLSGKPSIPSALSDLSDDSTHRLVTDSDKSAWNSKYDKPVSGIPASDLASGVIPSVPVTDVLVNGVSVVSNGNASLPTIPAAQVQTDWEAVSGMGVLLNKPVLSSVATSGSYNDLLNTPTIPDAVEANPTVPSEITPATFEGVKVGSSYYALDSLLARGNSAIWKATSVTSASNTAKTAGCSGFASSDLVVGAMVVVTFSNVNLAAPDALTLNIASRGAKPIKRFIDGKIADLDKPESLSGILPFIYDGTNWITWYESFDNDDGNCLDAKFGNVTFKQWKPAYTMIDGSYVKGEDGLLYEYSGSKYVEVEVTGAERVRFLGIYPKYSSWTNGFAFGKYENDQWVTIESEKFDYDTSQEVSLTKEYIRAVPSGATHFRTSCATSSMLALERNFYLYFQTGKPAVSQEELYSEVHPAIAATQPNGGFLPNIIYDLGEITGTVTFALASPTDNTIPNIYCWTFETSSTAPTITWPSNLTWAYGSAPTIDASKHYEIMVRKGYASALEF